MQLDVRYGLYRTAWSHCVLIWTALTLAERVAFLVVPRDVWAIEFSSVGLRVIVADVTLSTQQDDDRSFAIPAPCGPNITVCRKTSVCVTNYQGWNSTRHSPVVIKCTAQWSLYVPPSGHYMYHTAVTICTASLTFNNSSFSPHSVFMCFVWISKQTAIISLYNINWLVCITERACVYCAVRTWSVYVIQVNPSP
jgi:hypothetical protein